MNRVRNDYSNRNFYTTSSPYNNYNRTSEAFKYFPREYQNKPLKKKVNVKVKNKYVSVEQKQKYISAKFFVSMIIFITVSVSAISINAKVIEKRFEIDSLKEELKQLEEDNRSLKTEISKNLDLDYVEQYATSKLKMQKPSSHQTIHISVPKDTYVLKNLKGKNQSKFSLLNVLKNATDKG